MINGVLNIVAAVLFAVVSFGSDMRVVWLSIAAVYLLCGIINLIVHTLRVRKMQRAARKAEQEEVRKAAEAAVQAGQAAAKAGTGLVRAGETANTEEGA